MLQAVQFESDTVSILIGIGNSIVSMLKRRPDLESSVLEWLLMENIEAKNIMFRLSGILFNDGDTDPE